MEISTTTITCRNMIRAKIDLKRTALLGFGEEGADAADGVDFNVGATLGELLAKTMDINLDRVRGYLAGQAKNMVFDQLLGDHAILAPHQELEHGGLAGGQDVRPVVDEGLPAFGVEREVGS